MAKVLKQSTSSADFLLEDIKSEDLPSSGSFSITEFIKASLETSFLVSPGNAHDEPVHSLVDDETATDVLNGGNAYG